MIRKNSENIIKIIEIIISNSLFKMTLSPNHTTERYYLIARVLQSLENNMSKTADTLEISFNTVKNVAK